MSKSDFIRLKETFDAIGVEYNVEYDFYEDGGGPTIMLETGFAFYFDEHDRYQDHI